MTKDRRQDIMDKIAAKVIVDEDTDCWVWQGGTCGKQEETKGRGRGYGRISIDGTTMQVHRVVYTHFHGIIAHKRAIDHLCKNRLCCNPKHLEAVTTKENNRRKKL